jgi:flagellar protein FliJ
LRGEANGLTHGPPLHQSDRGARMGKFVFQLDPVLRHRKSVEEQRQRELGIAQAEMSKMEAELRAIDETARGVSDDVRNNRLTGHLDMSFLAAHRRYVLAMQRKALALAQRMATQQQVVDGARRQLAEAAKQRKIIEKLKERQHQRWRSELSRKEVAGLDEVNMQLAVESFFTADHIGRSSGGEAHA